MMFFLNFWVHLRLKVALGGCARDREAQISREASSVHTCLSATQSRINFSISRVQTNLGPILPAPEQCWASIYKLEN